MKINARAYETIARDVFAPVYPIIADQMIEKTGVTCGTCLDIGAGTGYLGMALAARTKLSVRLLDNNREMLKIAESHIAENRLWNRVQTLFGTVNAIPLPDDSVHLAVSRGSVFFWEDLIAALADIRRVLVPDGWAYIGGGFGSRKLKDDIVLKMNQLNNGDDRFSKKIAGNLGLETRTRFEAVFKSAGISSFSIIQSEDLGLWFIFKKA